jgi:hypothetical protein
MTDNNVEMNCDHFLEMIYIDGRNNSCCSKCHQKLNRDQISMMAQKGLAYCKDMIREQKEKE